MKAEAAGVIAATPPAALAMILFTITTLAADPAQFDASSGGAALFAAAGVDATTASFDAPATTTSSSATNTDTRCFTRCRSSTTGRVR